MNLYTYIYIPKYIPVRLAWEDGVGSLAPGLKKGTGFKRLPRLHAQDLKSGESSCLGSDIKRGNVDKPSDMQGLQRLWASILGIVYRLSWETPVNVLRSVSVSSEKS